MSYYCTHLPLHTLDICHDAGFHLGDIGNTFVHHFIDVIDDTMVDGRLAIRNLGIQRNISETCRSMDAYSVLNVMYLHCLIQAIVSVCCYCCSKSDLH